MNFNLITKIIYIITIAFFISCNINSKKNTASKTENEYNQNSLGKQEVKITNETTDYLCEVASFLNENDFNGDYYVNNGVIKWCMGVEAIEIPENLITRLLNEKVEYVVRARGVIKFGFFPDKNGEHGLLLNTEPINPLITSGNIKPKYEKLDKPKCLNLDWYYETYK
ncbi:hypothetical protein [Reichenbachiella sp. MSK19-1]|uniref:hypothetical protein n=1 Tax=Reichenbachiella sp. MSK19-1 TaxID=1897631 RepID=UPI000E6BDBB3|nr:hypothetical protein [Reichenbachiella sp. MSK19-1]RJE74494.1 hypothetical protein BGP76_15190 [Reichenbachiella sp. MSK19-1]